MNHLSSRTRHLELAPKGFVNIRNVLVIWGVIHLAVLYWGWRNGCLPKVLIGIGLFWLGLILLSALLTGTVWVWEKVRNDPARNQPNTPTLGGDLRIIFGLLMAFISLWAAHGLHKAFMISWIVVGSGAGLIILICIVLVLLPEKPK